MELKRKKKEKKRKERKKTRGMFFLRVAYTAGI
jgi:hypothetical protein